MHATSPKVLNNNGKPTQLKFWENIFAISKQQLSINNLIIMRHICIRTDHGSIHNSCLINNKTEPNKGP